MHQNKTAKEDHICARVRNQFWRTIRRVVVHAPRLVYSSCYLHLTCLTWLGEHPPIRWLLWFSKELIFEWALAHILIPTIVSATLIPLRLSIGSTGVVSKGNSGRGGIWGRRILQRPRRRCVMSHDEESRGGCYVIFNYTIFYIKLLKKVHILIRC